VFWADAHAKSVEGARAFIKAACDEALAILAAMNAEIALVFGCWLSLPASRGQKAGRLLRIGHCLKEHACAFKFRGEPFPLGG
jgi:hypothetical protein